MNESSIDTDPTSQSKNVTDISTSEHTKDAIHSPLHDVNQDETNASSHKNEDTALWAQDMFQVRYTDKLSAKTRRMTYVTLALLFILGSIAGIFNGLIILGSSWISSIQGYIITYHGYYSEGFLYFILSTIGFTVLSASLCKFFSKEAAGSGLPEFKALLAGEFKKSEYCKLVSKTILATKMVGLMLSCGSGLSLGSEGPLVHTAACIAYVLMTSFSEFEEILDSSSISKQIFAASAAIGISSTFNAPIGGLLFSVEATSTYYLISNYWKSFMAAAAGSVACYFFLFSKDGKDGDPLVVLQMKVNEHPFVKWEIVVFFFMSIALGYLSQFYLKLHQKMNVFLRPYNRQHPLATAAAVAFITAFFIYITGVFSANSVGVLQLVSDILNDGRLNEMQHFPNVEPIGGLIVSFIIRCGLTLMATNIMLPAGIFMPVFLIGGIFGRFIGQIMVAMTANSQYTVYPSSYALVGAVAFASGITQTISVAVIAIELTCNVKLFLPCIIAAATGAGISKSLGLSVYDQGMLNKGLETFQLLLMEYGGYNTVKNIMQTTFDVIPSKVSLYHLIKLLMASKQANFPQIESKESMKLVSNVSRVEIFRGLFAVFTAHNAQNILELVLPEDYHDEVDRIQKEYLREQSRQRRERMVQAMKESVNQASNILTEGSNSMIKTLNILPGMEDNNNNKNNKNNKEIDIEEAQRDTEMANNYNNSNNNSKNSNKSYSRLNSDDLPSEVDVNSSNSGRRNSVISMVDSAISTISNTLNTTNASSRAKETINDVEKIFAMTEMTEQLKREIIEDFNLSTTQKIIRNPFPFSIALETPMEQVYIFFEMVRVPCIYVVDNNRLIGMIGREHILESLRKNRK